MRLLADIRYSDAGSLEVRYYDGFLADSSGGVGVGQVTLTDWISVEVPASSPSPEAPQEPDTISKLIAVVKQANALVLELESESDA